MANSYKPAEPIMLSTPVGLDRLGEPFDPHAPFTACRLCGALMQTEKDRESKQLTDDGFHSLALRINEEQTELRHNWLELHNKHEHPDIINEMEALHLLGWAFMPSAAHKLAPFGITPLGNMHPDIVAALYEAPRAPNAASDGS